jgi:hypothetical protein
MEVMTVSLDREYAALLAEVQPKAILQGRGFANETEAENELYLIDLV